MKTGQAADGKIVVKAKNGMELAFIDRQNVRGQRSAQMSRKPQEQPFGCMFDPLLNCQKD